MRYFFGALLLLVFSAPTFAQQLIPQDDRKDPCRRFKMIVLVPTDFDRKMVAVPSDSLDQKMVVNPCPQVGVQIATIAPDNRGHNFVIVGPGVARQRLKFAPIQPPDFLIQKPKQPQP